MRLTLKRSGGFLGSALPPIEVDSDALLPGQQEHLEDLVRAADFFGLPKTLVAGPPGVDRFQFEMEVRDDGGRAHRVTFGEEGAPASLLDLARAMRDVAAKMTCGVRLDSPVILV